MLLPLPPWLAENGLGSGGGEGGGGELSDAQLSGLLPSLKQPDYYTEPSLQQLAAMARDDPASLASVANFTVGRRGVGSVRWLEPSDVRGLDLDATVQLSKGSIEVGGWVGGWVGRRVGGWAAACWLGGQAGWAGWLAGWQACSILFLTYHLLAIFPPPPLSPPCFPSLSFFPAGLPGRGPEAGGGAGAEPPRGSHHAAHPQAG